MTPVALNLSKDQIHSLYIYTHPWHVVKPSLVDGSPAGGRGDKSVAVIDRLLCLESCNGLLRHRLATEHPRRCVTDFERSLLFLLLLPLSSWLWSSWFIVIILWPNNGHGGGRTELYPSEVPLVCEHRCEKRYREWKENGQENTGRQQN